MPPQLSHPSAPARSRRMLTLAVAVFTLALTGCFRATGIQRTPMVAEVLPETGGDSVQGLKSKTGAGDLYLGNDFIQVAIDSTVYGDTNQTPLAGAVSGGSIVDAGYIQLDASYTRVSMPGDAMNRLTPVLNQDPNLEMVFSSYSTSNTGDLASISMTGQVLDPYNTLGTGTSPAAGVTVTHTLSVAQLEHYFLITTTVTNNSGTTLPIFNIADALIQQGSGYTFNVPAPFDYQGNPLATPWGVQIPGSDFSNPIATSVQAGVVGLVDNEPGADTLDSHCSLGFLPVDTDRLLVASDPQDLLTVSSNLRPIVPTRLVVGSLPAATGLAPGASLTYDRRLFILGGTSVGTNLVGGLTIPANYADMGNGLFNLMDSYRYNDISLRPVQAFGTLTFTLSDVSQRQGPLPTEVRIERNATAVTPPLTAADTTWQVQRVEYMVPNENLAARTGLAPSTLSVRLPLGLYRMVLTSQAGVQTRTLFENMNAVASPTGNNQLNNVGPIWIQPDQTFLVNPADVLCPSAALAAGDPNLIGPVTSSAYSMHYFETREQNSPAGNLQPLRMTFVGTNGTLDPVSPRMRTLATYYDSTNQVPQVAFGTIPGQYQFRAGNEMFGTGFTNGTATEFAWFPNGGQYTVYGNRGPLSALVSASFTTQDGDPNTSHVLTVLPWGLPPGWTSFDLPGPGQATTGGYLPGEKCASALANGIQVVGHTEQDRAVNAPALYTNFRTEFTNVALTSYQLPAALNAMNRPPNEQVGEEPFVVGGRTSTLGNYGDVAALFTPLPADAPMGGALPSAAWTLSDFITQAQGQYNVVLRPRGPAGLFTLQEAPVPTPPAWNSALNGWWSTWSQETGPLSFGATNGGFDALELLRGESLAEQGMTLGAWFTEFLEVRSDWFGLLNYQTPTAFTKALGLSSAKYSLDTPVGLARTYLKTVPLYETDLSGVLAALRSGAAVASTGPFLDVSISGVGPGGLVAGPVENVTLTVNLWRTDWMPVNELRVIVNGTQVVDPAITLGALAPSGTDPRLYTGSFTLTQAELQTVPGRDAWVVVEAGVPLTAVTDNGGVFTATYPTDPVVPSWVPWNTMMRGIYPIAVTNPIFVNVTGDGYKPPMQ